MTRQPFFVVFLVLRVCSYLCRKEKIAMEPVTISQFNGIYFTSDMPDVQIPMSGNAVKAHVTLTCGGTTVYDEVLWPSDSVVTLYDLGEMLWSLVRKSLSVQLTVSAQLQDEDDEQVGSVLTTTATILFSSADVGIPAQQFYTSYFLSILMGTKITAHGRLEYLWYYGNDSATVTAEYADGTTSTFNALVSGSSSVYTQLDVSPDYYEQTGKQLVAYTVRAGNRSQRFEMDLEEPDCAPILEFFNSFGVWELIYCTGTHEVTPDYKRSSTRVKGMLRNYQVDETRTFKANTGILNNAMANWAEDLFRSVEVYVVNVVQGQIVGRSGGREITITESASNRSNNDDAMPRFTFSYQYAQRIHNVLQLDRVGRIFDNTFDHTFN